VPVLKTLLFQTLSLFFSYVKPHKLGTIGFTGHTSMFSMRAVYGHDKKKRWEMVTNK